MVGLAAARLERGGGGGCWIGEGLGQGQWGQECLGACLCV